MQRQPFKALNQLRDAEVNRGLLISDRRKRCRS
jgi:hypothetical protein